MAAAHVQSTGIQSAGSVNSVAKAYTSNVTSGNLLVCGGITSGADMPTTAVTDSRSSSYTRDIIFQRTVPGTGERSAIFRAAAASSGACTVTLNCTGNDFQSIAISEFSGATTTGPEATNSGQQSSGTTPTTGNVTLATAGLVWGVVSHGNGGTVSITEGGTFSLVFEDEDTADMPINGEYKLVAAGTYTANWTLGTNSANSCVAATYVESAAATKAPPPLLGRRRPYRFFGRRSP